MSFKAFQLLTLVWFGLIFASNVSCTSSPVPTEEEMGKLVFANVLFRHGDRTPIDPYPNDPYRNRSYWPVGFGQLTNTGKRQEYELGLWLRQRYDSLLTEHYSPETFYIQSTDVDRCLMSAESVLAALYPPRDGQRWEPDLNWQPIPIHTTPEHMDKVLSAKAPCPAYDSEHEKMLNSHEIKELNEKYAEVYKVLNENTGKTMSDFTEIEYVYNALFIENLYNFTLPSWTKSVFPEPLAEISKYSFAFPTWTLKLARLKAGLLVKDMIDHMKLKAADSHKQHPAVWMYSAHDATIANLLHALNVFDLQTPPYSSTVMMELRQDNLGNYQVTLFYRNSSTEEPHLLTLPGCTPVCPLDQFIVQCEAVIPKDWDRECQATSLFPLTSRLSYSNLTSRALGISCSLLILLLGALAAVYYQRRRNHPTHCNPYSKLSIPAWNDQIEKKKPYLKGPKFVSCKNTELIAQK